MTNEQPQVENLTVVTPDPTTQFDSPWKDMIEHRFEDFTQFFFPHLHRRIDWTQGYEFLDQELQKVVREAVTKGRRVDKLVKVWLTNGQAELLYIHIEVQSQYDKGFPERVFIYHYRLYDRYGPRITSLAILGDDRKDWRPDCYSYETIGSQMVFEFTSVKLLDYADKWDELAKLRNPFSVVVRTHLKGLETRRSPAARFDWKVTLYKALHEEGYSEEEILQLYHFLDWMLTLPEGLTQRFDDFVEEYEEAKTMQYVTSIERRGIQKGIQQGVLQNSREKVGDILDVRFQQVPMPLVQQIQAIDDLSLLSKLHREAIVVPSLEAFEQLVKQAVKKDI